MVLMIDFDYCRHRPLVRSYFGLINPYSPTPMNFQRLSDLIGAEIMYQQHLRVCSGSKYQQTERVLLNHRRKWQGIQNTSTTK